MAERHHSLFGVFLKSQAHHGVCAIDDRPRKAVAALLCETLDRSLVHKYPLDIHTNETPKRPIKNEGPPRRAALSYSSPGSRRLEKPVPQRREGLLHIGRQRLSVVEIERLMVAGHGLAGLGAPVKAAVFEVRRLVDAVDLPPHDADLIEAP